MRADLLQNPVEVLQRVSVDKAPPSGVTLTEIVCMLQAHAPAGAAVTLQPADVQVQMADGTLCIVLVILVEALGGVCASGTLDP